MCDNKTYVTFTISPINAPTHYMIKASEEWPDLMSDNNLFMQYVAVFIDGKKPHIDYSISVENNP